MAKTALITGASSGIGLELAYEYAKKHYNLILIARRRNILNDLKNNIEDKYGVQVYIFAKDLSKEKSPKDIFESVKKLNIPIDVLINNAGFGKLDEFSEMDEDLIRNMINVNITALTRLTRLFLPSMKRRRKGKIINISSVAAYFPGPFMAVYFATKAYVNSLSEALSEELKSYGIKVFAICPGPTRTGFQDVAGMKRLNLKGIPSAKDLAKYTIKISGTSKRVAIYGISNKINSIIARILPKKLVLFSISKVNGK